MKKETVKTIIGLTAIIGGLSYAFYEASKKDDSQKSKYKQFAGMGVVIIGGGILLSNLD